MVDALSGVGTLYGVHRFLEEVLGVRWLAPDVTREPMGPVVVPALDRTVRPAFEWRHTCYAWPGQDADFKARVADNNGSAGADRPHGLDHAHDGRAHSYFRYVSPDELFDTHPESFSEIGGVRVREPTRLCLTNPDVLEIVTERMLARMAASPGVRQHDFSQMDDYNYCTCPNCRAVNERYGTNGGTRFWFVNKLAERTSKVFPDKRLGTLSYTYGEEPPRGLEMHPNAAVWLRHKFPSCARHPIASCPRNADFKRRAETWSQLTDHLYLWHYVVDFMHYYAPFPNLGALSANLRFYRDLGVEGYYGAAAQPIGAYLEMLQRKVDRDDIHMHLYSNPAQGYLPDELLAEANARFDEAEALVRRDPELLERVRVARMPLTYAKLFPRNGYAIENGRLDWAGELATLDRHGHDHRRRLPARAHAGADAALRRGDDRLGLALRLPGEPGRARGAAVGAAHPAGAGREPRHRAAARDPAGRLAASLRSSCARRARGRRAPPSSAPRSPRRWP